MTAVDRPANPANTQPWDAATGPQRKDFKTQIGYYNARDCWLECGKPHHGPCHSNDCPRRGEQPREGEPS